MKVSREASEEVIRDLLRVVTFKKGDQLKHKVTGSTLYVDHVMIRNRDLLIITEYGDRIPYEELINISWQQRMYPPPEVPQDDTQVDVDSLFIDGATPESLTGF